LAACCGTNVTAKTIAASPAIPIESLANRFMIVPPFDR
jgi:hypothetical protein